MNPQSNILDKIRKLLRLADRSRGATENEAKGKYSVPLWVRAQGARMARKFFWRG